MLNNIDALLASGDTNAALLVIDLVTGLLDAPASGAAENQTEAKKAKTAVSTIPPRRVPPCCSLIWLLGLKTQGYGL